MAKIIDANGLFQNSQSQTKVLEDKIEFYRNYLLLYEGIPGYPSYYLTFHSELLPTDEFVDIYCPHCGYPLNDTTFSDQKAWVHGKHNEDEDIYDRSNWGFAEIICPHCDNKLVLVFE